MALVFEPLTRRGDGFRVGALGNTGTGKTYALRRVVEVPGQLVLVHDVKARPEYPELRQFRTVAELEQLPPEELAQLSACSFRGDPFAGVDCDPEEVAALALRLARNRAPVRLVVDETDNGAVTPGGRVLASESLRRCCTQGRAMGLSVCWSTQSPARAPTELVDQSSAIMFFRLEHRALVYLDERLRFDAELLEVIEALPDRDFVLHRQGYPWDRCVYRF